MMVRQAHHSWIIGLLVIGGLLVSCGRVSEQEGVPSYSGVITFDGPGTLAVPNITLNLDDAATQVATTDADGAFTFTAEAGTHTITPTRAGWVFNPTSLSVSSATTTANFVASIEGWTVTQFSGIDHHLYGISYTTLEGGNYVMAGSDGKAHTSIDGLNWDKLTHDDITGAGDFISCIITYLGSNHIVILLSKSKEYLYAKATLPSGGEDVSYTYNYSSFTTEAEDVSLFAVGVTNETFMVAGGGLYRNSNYTVLNAADFGATNLAPDGMTVRSVSANYVTPNYYILIGGDNGALYSYIGADSPGNSGWTELASGTTEKITGIGAIWAAVTITPFVTESGSVGYVTANSDLTGWSDWEILFSGLPYSLYSGSQITATDALSGVTVVGSGGFYLKKD